MTYFKQTTRNLLTQREKDETINAVRSASSYLSDRYYSFEPPEIKSIYDVGRGLRYTRNAMPYLFRIMNLTKGTIQQKRFYRDRRKSQIFWESVRIAQETGADRETVEQMFERYMKSYLHS
jgi:hypothetical protein